MAIHHAHGKSKKSTHHYGNGHDHEASSSVVDSDTIVGTAIVNSTLEKSQVPLVAREQMIAELAYQYAEARGFTPGHDLEDWLAAEHEVSVRLADPSRHHAL